MSSIFTRVLGIGFVTLSASALVMSCASSDTNTPAFGNGGSGAVDSGPDSSSGGAGGMATGGTGAGGTGGMATGGTGAGGSSTGGTGAGGSGAGGTGGGTGTGGSGGGTCNPAFCPTSGFGTPCCVTPNGPCGVDTGTGCQQGSTGSDF